MRSALAVTIDHPVDSPFALLTAIKELPMQLASCLLIAAGLILLRRLRVSFKLIITATIVGSLCVFYAVTTPLELTRESLVEKGWLFDRAELTPFYSVWTSHDFSRVRWTKTTPPLNEVFGMIVILVISLVLRISGIASATGRSIDMDKEMQLTGGLNIVVGLLGGQLGSHSPGLVSLNKETGATSRLPGIAQAKRTHTHSLAVLKVHVVRLSPLGSL